MKFIKFVIINFNLNTHIFLSYKIRLGFLKNIILMLDMEMNIYVVSRKEEVVMSCLKSKTKRNASTIIIMYIKYVAKVVLEEN